jgi:cell fate (sporulation/competence/biofilm development) regulator YlbF (YheA/YmcA/DUF963 family)
MIIDKAVEISNLIRESEELIRYKNAKKELKENPELEHDLNYYINLLDSLDASEISFENLEEDQREEIELLEEMFSKNSIVKDYLSSEANLKEMLTMINKIINQAMNR